jgi:uncharacterized membrane protein YeiH
MLEGQFQLPMAYDLIAVFLFAVSGALVAYRKGYDYLGLFALALVTGAGGGLIRDGIFLQQGPPVLVTNWRYLVAIFTAALLVIIVGERIRHVMLVVILADAMGLGFYAVVGSQMSINIGLDVMAAGLIGLINAVGGGLLRDMISGEEPLLFKPGQFYAAAALVGVIVFLGLGVGFKINAQVAALIAIGVTFALRVLAIVLDIRTHPIQDHKVRKSVGKGVRRILRRKDR